MTRTPLELNNTNVNAKAPSPPYMNAAVGKPVKFECFRAVPVKCECQGSVPRGRLVFTLGTIPRNRKGGTRYRGNQRGGSRYRGNEKGGTRYRGKQSSAPPPKHPQTTLKTPKWSVKGKPLWWRPELELPTSATDALSVPPYALERAAPA